MTTSVVGHAAHNGGVEIWDIREFVGIIWLGDNRLTQVFADLGGIHVNAQGELNIAE